MVAGPQWGLPLLTPTLMLVVGRVEVAWEPRLWLARARAQRRRRRRRRQCCGCVAGEARKGSARGALKKMTHHMLLLLLSPVQQATVVLLILLLLLLLLHLGPGAERPSLQPQLLPKPRRSLVESSTYK